VSRFSFDRESSRPWTRCDLDHNARLACGAHEVRGQLGTSIALLRDMMNTEDSVLLAAMRRAPRGEPPVRPVRLQRLSAEARDALDDMMASLEEKLEPLGMERDRIRRDVFELLSIEGSRL
jgi:hypothetical protein